jgi:hypothetical protein
MTSPKDEKFSEQEAQRRFEAAIRIALSGPAKPHSEMKLGKPRGKPSRSPGKRKAVKKR